MNILLSSWFVSLLGGLLYLATMVVTITSTQFVASSPGGGSLHETAAPGSIWSASSPEIDTLIVELKKEKDSLALREKHLNELAEQLKKQRQEINQATQTVHQLQTEFDRTVVRVRDEEAANLKKLAKVYATMPPDGAANILNNMEDDQIVRFMVFMKEGEIAPLFEAISKLGDLQSKRVGVLSERLRMAMFRNTANPSPRP